METITLPKIFYFVHFLWDFSNKISAKILFHLYNLLHFIFGVLLDYISHYMFKAYILKALQNLSLPLELFKPAFMAIHCHLHRPLMSEQSITFKFNCVHTFSRLPKVQFKHMFRMNPVLVVKRLFALCDETAHRQESS